MWSPRSVPTVVEVLRPAGDLAKRRIPGRPAGPQRASNARCDETSPNIRAMRSGSDRHDLGANLNLNCSRDVATPQREDPSRAGPRSHGSAGRLVKTASGGSSAAMAPQRAGGRLPWLLEQPSPPAPGSQFRRSRVTSVVNRRGDAQIDRHSEAHPVRFDGDYSIGASEGVRGASFAR